MGCFLQSAQDCFAALGMTANEDGHCEEQSDEATSIERMPLIGSGKIGEG
jgi:hypothetical protein